MPPRCDSSRIRPRRQSKAPSSPEPRCGSSLSSCPAETKPLDEEAPQEDGHPDAAHRASTSNEDLSDGPAAGKAVLPTHGVLASSDLSDASHAIECTCTTTYNFTEETIRRVKELLSEEGDCSGALAHETLSPLQDLVPMGPTNANSSISVPNFNDCTPLAGASDESPSTHSPDKISAGVVHGVGARGIAFLESRSDSVKAGSLEPEQPDIENATDPHAFPNINCYENLLPEATGSQAPLTLMRTLSMSDARKLELETHEKNRCKFEDKEDWEVFRKILVITDYQTCVNEEEVAYFRADISFFYELQEAGAKSWIYYDGTYTLTRCEDGYHIFDFDMERTCLISDDREKFFRFMTNTWREEDGDLYWVSREDWGKDLEYLNDEGEWCDVEDVDVGGNGYQVEATRTSITARDGRSLCHLTTEELPKRKLEFPSLGPPTS